MGVGRADVKQHLFLISSLRGGERSALRAGRFNLLWKNVRYPLARRLLEPQSHCGRGGEKYAKRTSRLSVGVLTVRITARRESVASDVQTRRKRSGTCVSL